MAEELFDIYFSGKLMPGTEELHARAEVGKIFKASDDALNKLFSGKSVKIKKSVDMDTAIKYRLRFRDAGALVDIRPVKASPQAVNKSSAQSQVDPEPSTTTSKAINPQTTDKLLDDLLMPVGTTIDQTPEVDKLEINTDDLVLNDANKGSLEEFARNIEPAELPDISDLTFGPDDIPLDSTPPAPPAQIDISKLAIDSFSPVLDDSLPTPDITIDTSNLTASDANSGSLEEFNSRPEPQPLPDISNLEIIEK